MSGTPLSQSTPAVGYRLRRDDEADAPTTFGELDTPEGLAVLRVREFSVPCHVGGHGQPVPTRIYEVAVRTPKTVRDRLALDDDGFVVLVDSFLDAGGRVPATHLDVHLSAGVWALRQCRARLAERAADRPATPSRRVAKPQLPSAPGMEEPGDGGPARPSLPPAEDGPPRRLRVVRPSRPQAA